VTINVVKYLKNTNEFYYIYYTYVENFKIKKKLLSQNFWIKLLFYRELLKLFKYYGILIRNLAKCVLNITFSGCVIMGCL